MDKTKVFKNAADILAFDDIPTEEVWVEEWQTWVRVRGMSGRERDSYDASFLKVNGTKTQGLELVNVRARLVARCVIGKDDRRMFTDAQIEKLGSKSGAALDKIFEVAQRLSGISESDIKELEENLESPQSEDFGLS